VDQTTLYLFAAIAIFIAGTIKGAVGFGLPTTALVLLTLMVDARTAIALVLIPMFVSNVWQLYRAGHVIEAIRRYLPFIICLCLGILIAFFLTVGAPERLLLGALGVIILIYVTLTATGFQMRIRDKNAGFAQVLAGSISGAMGGIVSVWAPPMLIYLSARQVSKDEFVRASGLILCVGSIPLIFGYARAGFLTPNLALAATCLLVPTFAGFALGEALRSRLSEKGFRRSLLIVFALMGLNLIRRAVF